MGQLFLARLPDLTIANGQTTSDVLDCKKTCYDAEAIVIRGPLAGAETFTFEVSLDGGLSYSKLQNIATGTDIAGPLTGKSIIYNGIFTGITHLRIVANGAVGAARVFQLSKSWRGE